MTNPPALLSFGTMHFCVAGHRRVITCSDGARWNNTGVASESAVKAHEAGRHTILASVGCLELADPTDSRAGLISIPKWLADLCQVDELRDEPFELIDELIDVERCLTKSHEYGLLNYNFRNMVPRPITAFQAFAVKRTPVSGEIQLAALRFPLVWETEGVSVGAADITKQNLGIPHPGEPRTYCAGTSVPDSVGFVDTDDLSDLEILNWSDAVFGAARARVPYVGPPYDIAEIGDAGIRWLRRQATLP